MEDFFFKSQYLRSQNLTQGDNPALGWSPSSALGGLLNCLLSTLLEESLLVVWYHLTGNQKWRQKNLEKHNDIQWWLIITSSFDPQVGIIIGPLIARFSSKIKEVEGKKERKKITWVPRLKDVRNTQLSPWWNLSQPHACLPNVRNNINIILLDGRVLI